MRQVLFHIPIYIDGVFPNGIPIFGYGMMLFLAFVACTFLATWLGRKERIPTQQLQDLAIWLFVFGLLGARITFMLQYGLPLSDFFKIWDGGLVFYGSFLGGLVGYTVAYFLVLRKHAISSWKMADLIAPCLAIGLCLGRMGCFLNGCCYGNVACAECPAVHFPLSSPARYDLVRKGFQTPAGFTVPSEDVPVRVGKVEPGSLAQKAGLRDGDVILKANDQEMKITLLVREPDEQDGDNWQVVKHSYDGLESYLRALDHFKAAGRKIVGEVTEPLTQYLVRDWPRGETELQLTVRHKNGSVEELPSIRPVTLGLHPTQLYESISMALLFLLLLAYYPFRRHHGEVMVVFMVGYAVHRFLNEILRKDTDPVAFGMTLSQNGSILLLLAGLALGWWLWRQPVQSPAA